MERKLKINKPNDALTVMLGNNCVAFLFYEIRYELNGVEINRNRNVGITSTLKNYVSLTSGEDKNMENAYPYSTLRCGKVAGWLQQPCTWLRCCIVAAQCRCMVAATLPCNIARGGHRIVAA